MRYIRIDPGTTSRSINIAIYKDDGTANTSLVYNTSGLAARYRRDNGTLTSITLVTLSSATATYSSGGFIHVGSGVYRLDVPNAVLAASATTALVLVDETTDIRAEPIVIDFDVATSTRLISTDARLPASAAAGASGGLAILDSSGNVPADLRSINNTSAAGLDIINDDYAAGIALRADVDSIAGDISGLAGLNLLGGDYFGGYLGVNVSQVGGQDVQCVGGDITTARLSKLDRLPATGTVSTFAGGAVTSVTGSVGSIAANGVTAASVAASALNGKGDWQTATQATLDHAANISAWGSVAGWVWTYSGGARTLTSFGTLVADFWAYLATSATTSGSIGKRIADFVTTSPLTAQETADALKQAPSAGEAEEGSVYAGLEGIAEGKETQVAQIAAALSGHDIAILSPVLEDGSIELVAGDDYSGDRAIVLRLTGYTGTATPTLALRAIRQEQYVKAGDTTIAALNVTGAYHIDGTTITMTFEPDEDDTGGLSPARDPGKGSTVYRAQVIDTASHVTLWSGQLVARRRIEAT